MSGGPDKSLVARVWNGSRKAVAVAMLGLIVLAYAGAKLELGAHPLPLSKPLDWVQWWASAPSDSIGQLFLAIISAVTRERAPLDWAMTSGTLGITLVQLGQRQTDPTLVKNGINAITATATEARKGGHAPAAAFFDNALQKALALLRTMDQG